MMSAAIRDTGDVWVKDILPGDRPTILGIAAKADAAAKDDETKKESHRVRPGTCCRKIAVGLHGPRAAQQKVARCAD